MTKKKIDAEKTEAKIIIYGLKGIRFYIHSRNQG